MTRLATLEGPSAGTNPGTCVTLRTMLCLSLGMAISYLIRGLSPDVIERARARARAEGVHLSVVAKRLFEEYADDLPHSPQAMGKKGGRSRAAKMSSAQRKATASSAAKARWAKAKQ